LQRCKKNGEVDSSFGTTGKVYLNTDVGKSDMIVEGDNKIIISGNYSYNSYSNFAVTRYKPNGRIDKSFGSNGMTFTDFGLYSNTICSTIQGDKILLGGTSMRYPDTAYPYNFAIARYENDSVQSLAKDLSPVKLIPSNSISIYPNPANNFIYVDGLKEGLTTSILMTNTNGKTVSAVQTNQSSQKISLQNLAAGIYYISIHQDGKTIKQKFIKQ